MFRYPRREGNREVVGNAAVSADGGEKRKPLAKRVFRGVYPQTSSPNFSNVSRPIFVFMYLRGCDKDENKV
jgi:hypothetical protein